MFNTYINYWYYTGDTQYNAMVKQGLQFQTGPDNNYMVCDTHAEMTLRICSDMVIASKRIEKRRKR